MLLLPYVVGTAVLIVVLLMFTVPREWYESLGLRDPEHDDSYTPEN